MMRSESNQKIITLAWFEETKKSALIAQIIKFILYFLFFTQPIGIIILGFQADHYWLIYFSGLGAYIPICWYVFANLKKVPRQIEKGLYQNITKSLPGSLEKMVSEILGSFRIPGELIEYWVNNKAFGVSPTVVSYKRKYHVILPLGYVKLLTSNEVHARQILAHEFSHIRQKDTDLLLMIKLFLRAAMYFLIPMLMINFLFSVYFGLNANLEAKSRRNSVYFDRMFSDFAQKTNGDGSAVQEYLKSDSEYRDQKQETTRKIIYLAVLTIGIIYLIRSGRKMIYRSERVADLGGVVVGSSGNMIQTLEAYTTQVNKWRFLRINPPINWRIDQLRKTEQRLQESDLTYNPCDVEFEMFSYGYALPLLVFLCFVIVVFPFIFLTGVYQMFHLPEVQDEILLWSWLEMICKFMLTGWGISLGFQILKGQEKDYRSIWIFCLVNLAFIIVDSLLFALIFAEGNRNVVFVAIIKSQWFTFIVFLAGAIYYNLPRDLFMRKKEAGDFSGYKYHSVPANNISLNLKKWEYYVLQSLLLVIIPLLFLKTYPFLILNPFQLERGLVSEIDYLIKYSILNFSVFVISFLSMIVGFVAGLHLWQRNPDISKYLKALIGLNVFILAAKYVFVISDESLKDLNWYWWDFKIESGFILGSLVLLSFTAVILTVIILWMKKWFHQRGEKIYFNSLLGLCTMLLLVLIISAFSNIPRNEYLADTIKVSDKRNCVANVCGVSNDFSKVYTTENVDDTTAKIVIWDLKGKNAIREKKVRHEIYNSVFVKYNASANCLIIGAKDSVCIYNADLTQKLSCFSIKLDYSDIGFSSDLSIFAGDVSLEGGTSVEIFDRTNSTSQFMADSNYVVWYENLSPDGNLVILKLGKSYESDIFRVYNTRTTEWLYSIFGNEDTPYLFSADSKSVFYLEKYNPVMIIANAKTGEETGRIVFPNRWFHSSDHFVLSNSGRYICTFNESGPEIEFFDFKGNKVRTLKDHRKINSAFFSIDDKFLVTGGGDGEIKVFRTGL